MQATLADSAVYVRFLRKRVLELELEQSRHTAKTLLGQQGAGSTAQQEGARAIRLSTCRRRRRHALPYRQGWLLGGSAQRSYIITPQGRERRLMCAEQLGECK